MRVQQYDSNTAANVTYKKLPNMVGGEAEMSSSTRKATWELVEASQAAVRNGFHQEEEKAVDMIESSKKEYEEPQ